MQWQLLGWIIYWTFNKRWIKIENTEGTIKNKLSSDTGINGYKTEKTNKQTKNTMQKTKYMSNTDSTKKLEKNQGVRNG